MVHRLNFRGAVRRSKQMPYYEYHCEENGETLEVRHSMNDHVATWGELAVMADGRFEVCGSGCACVPQD
jgi:CO dehydrogenase nickel-insertion accessory protein CooC1